MLRYLNQETGLDYPTSPQEMGVIMRRFYDRCQELGGTIAERSLDPQHAIKTRGRVRHMMGLGSEQEGPMIVEAPHLVKAMFMQDVHSDYLRTVHFDGPIDDRRCPEP